MPNAIVCPNPTVLLEDPRFQDVVNAFKSKSYPDDFLAQAILQYRKKYELGDDWFPVEARDRARLTRYINNDMFKQENMPTESKITKDSVTNIYTTLYRLYTPEQLDDRLDMLFQNFCDEVDKLEHNDTLNRSRQDLIEAQGTDTMNGFQVIMARVFDTYAKNYTLDAMMERWNKANPDASEEQKAAARERFQEIAEEYRVMQENKNRLAALVAPMIGEIEGFRVNTENFEIELDEKETDDSENTDTENGQDKTEGSKGDRYVDYRTLKMLNTIGVRARRLLSRIPRTNVDGTFVRSDIGSIRHLNVRQAAYTLMRALVHSTPDSMMNDLREAQLTSPWIGNLVSRLERDPDLQTTIYCAMKRAESIYMYTDKSKGIYATHIANTRSRGNAMMQEMGNNLRGGFVQEDRFSIYTGYGQLVSPQRMSEIREGFSQIAEKVKDLTGVIRMVEGEKALKEKFVNSEIERLDKKYGGDHSYLKLPGEQAMEQLIANHPEIVTDITALLRGIGYSVTEENIHALAGQQIGKKNFRYISSRGDYKTGHNRLYLVVDQLDRIYKAVDAAWKNNTPTGQYLYNTISTDIRRMTSIVSLSAYKDVEPRALVEDKTYSTYNQVNPMHQVFDLLANRSGQSEEQYRQTIEDEYLRYEGYAIGSGVGQQVFGWLRKLVDNEDGMRDNLRVIDGTTINHKQYSQLSRVQKHANALVMYFNGGRTLNRDNSALYEGPIQGDYSTSYNFISAPKIVLTKRIGELKEGETEDIIEALVDEVLLENDRISLIERRACPKIYDDEGKLVDNPEYDPNRAPLTSYEKQGIKFQIFPGFNKTGLRTQLRQTTADEARAIVREAVKQEMLRIVRHDIEVMERDGVFKDKALRNLYTPSKEKLSLYSKDGTFTKLSPYAQRRVEEYCLNVFYAREQICKLVTGGLEQFNGLIDYEKRNMYSHATHTSLHTSATWNGERVGKESQNAVYIEDDKVKSAVFDELKDLLDQLLAEGIIDKNQHKIILDNYASITTSDGQAFRTFKSYREIMIMTDQWSDRMEDAYDRIVAGVPTKGDIDLFIGQVVKPVFNGYEHIEAAPGEGQKPVKLTVLHKYAEAILLPQTLAKYCLQSKAVPTQALERANQELGGDVDVFLFHSCVKVGYHSGLTPLAKWKDIKAEVEGETDEDARKRHGWTGEDLDQRIFNDAKSMSDYIVSEVRGNKWTKHQLKYKYYGIAASTPAHAADDKIAWAAQAEKVAWANVLRGQKIVVNGKEMDAWDARELYFSIKSANIIEDYDKVRELFHDADSLSKVFREEIAERGYTSNELLFALNRLENGTFAVPLFSPNVAHQVQELLSSMIKKRLTKTKTKGANILQTTSLGMDLDVSSFEENAALKDHQKLRIVFEGTGKNRRIKYVEVYLPMIDSRFKQFADENGNIGPERLQKLVEAGIIPEETLQFIAYRTPSDAEHSVIPCRIKGFLANAGGAAIIMPKEIMKMTGHDYDGDKMRCHFPDFKVVWDTEKLHKEYEKYLNGVQDVDLMRYILGLENSNELVDEKTFIRKLKRYESENHSVKYKKIEYTQYDYDISNPLLQSRTARENARIQLMFSKLTSPEGSRRMVIPGGCDDTKVYARTIKVIQDAQDREERVQIAKVIKQQEKNRKRDDKSYRPMSDDEIASAVNTTTGLYNLLTSRTEWELDDIVRSISGNETPFSATHAVDAYEYIMGGAEMIGIYALYNSAMQMMQRLNLRYVPRLTKQGKEYKVTLLGNTFGEKKLFDVRNHKGELNILGLARLLNAAVDNNKAPVLGMLNQTKELSELTFFLFANGATEEDIHLLMNQPVMRELAQRLKASNSLGFVGEANAILSELKNDKKYIGDITPWIGVANVGKMSKDDFVRGLDRDYSELEDQANRELIEQQASLLQMLLHIHPAVDTLATFARLTRPESESGAIGTSIADIIVKNTALQDFRKKLAAKDADRKLGISGMRGVMRAFDVQNGVSEDAIYDELGNELPEVVALNNLMIGNSLDLMKAYFPQAKDSWSDVINEILSGYVGISEKQKTAIADHIANEMILFKLLEDKNFVAGDSQEEQMRILGYTEDGGVPWQLKQLKERIAKAQKQRDFLEDKTIYRRKDGTEGYYDEKNNWHEVKIDYAAEELIGNIFLEKLTFTSPEHSVVPRIKFDLGGPAVENQADTIRAYWGYMLDSEDEGIRKLAMDLFKYNMYTNGFNYGLYEFAHFAPFNLLMEFPGYIDALNRILRSGTWKNEEEKQNFIDQYYMNHWGEEKFVPQIVNWGEAKRTYDKDGIVKISSQSPEEVLDFFETHRYIVNVVRREDEDDEYHLYYVDAGDNECAYVLRERTKLGVRNREQQVTLQYNPSQLADEIEALVPANNSPWNDLYVVSERDAYAEADITAPDDRLEQAAPEPDVKAAIFDAMRAYVSKKKVEQMEKLQDAGEKADAKNDLPQETPTEAGLTDMEESRRDVPDPTEEPENVRVEFDFGGLGISGLSPDAMAAFGASMLKGNEELHIARIDEKGNVISENVPASMRNISLARKQRTFVRLNKKLAEMFREKGVTYGALTNMEARLSIAGVADFDTAKVTAEGLREMIRIADGYLGEQALPEEFAHLALEMLGHDHPLVSRLLDALNTDEAALQDAFSGMYDDYAEAYKNDRDKLVLEAAGKLVARELFYHEELKNPLKRLIHRVVEAIKNLLRRFRGEEIQEAIFEAEDIASKIAREMLGGKLIDDMSIDNIDMSGQLLKKTAQDLSNKEDILSKLLKTEQKRLSVLQKRLAYKQKNTTTLALDYTEEEILKLQKAVKNHKTEDAVLTYIRDAVRFLTQTNDSLIDLIKNGAKVNSICKRLNTVRDTLYSFSGALEAIEAAISEKEIQDDAGIQEAIRELSAKLGQYYANYNHIAMQYFEEMLSSVYGKDGITVTIGKDKGRKISIHEMARKADGDISFAARWFNSIADCNDYVLKAIDDIVRDAKARARAEANNIQRDIEVAFAKLVRETGSKDQSFMFETVKGKDGKMHRTGKYIDAKTASKLSKPQYEYYKTILDIKERADELVPESLVEDRKIVMLRKTPVDKFHDSTDLKGRTVASWDMVRSKFSELTDDSNREYDEVAVDFEGNKVDMLPVKFMLKGKNESYDDMTDDVATSIMAYAGMAYEYAYLNNVIGVLENAKYMASQRNVKQKTGWRQQRESVGDEEKDYAFYKEPFTVKQAHTRIQEALTDFFQMHIYGHLQKDEGTIPGTNISVRGAVNAINSLASLTQMAVNLSQRVANVSTGQTQIIIESAGKGVYNAKDLLWAAKTYMIESGDRLAETGKDHPTNKLSLFDERFDIHQDNGRHLPHFKKGRLSRIFGTNLLYAGLTMGEDYLANLTALAAARNYKMLDAEGKESNLWEAYEVKYTDPENEKGAYLAVKEGWTKPDGTQLTADDERAFMKSVVGLNFDLQGIYNIDDRSAVQQHAFGALLIMYRKWIAPSLKRRYGNTQYSKLKGEFEEGYYRTFARLVHDSVVDAKEQVTEGKSAAALLNIYADMKALINAWQVNKSKLTAYENSNVRRSWTELGIVFGLFIAASLAGKVPPPDDDDRKPILKWWDNFALSQMLRLRTEIGSQAPTPMMVNEATKILKSPFAALRPIQDALNIYKLFIPSNYWTTIKSGRYRGHTRAYKYFHELPGISMWKRIDNFIDPTPLINYYKNDSVL